MEELCPNAFLLCYVNPMGWFLKLEHKGHSLYPTLQANFEKPEYYVNDKVRGEGLRHFGYFMTESTGHLSEYLPYFHKNQKALDLYGGESGAYYDWCQYVEKSMPKRIFSPPNRTSCRRAASSTALTSSRPLKPARPSSSTVTSSTTA